MVHPQAVRAECVERDELARLLALHEAALGAMAHGVCLYDANLRVVLHNRAFTDHYGLSPEVLRRGVTMREVFLHAAKRLQLTPEQLDLAWAHRELSINSGKAFSDTFRLPDGRVIKATSRPTPDGGWVISHEEITGRVRQAEALREQNLRFDAAINNMSQALAMLDADQRLIVCNDKYRILFSADASVVKPGATLKQIFEYGVSIGLYPGVTADALLARRMAAIAEQRTISYDQPMADGRTISITTSPMADGGWVGTFEDVTEGRKIEAERAAMLAQLREQRDRFNAALDNMSHGLVMIDENMRVIVSNRRYHELFRLPPGTVHPGISMREVMAHSIAAGNYPGQTAEQRYALFIERIKSPEGVAVRHLGDGRVVQVTHRPMPKNCWVATYEDITERHRAEERIAHMARHDALTDLPNRVLFREKMDEALARIEAGGEAMAVLYLDLDHFKTVNDTLGHPVGDRLLSAVARRLHAVIPAGDCIARLGGDEFAILQTGPQPDSADALARRILEVMPQPT